MQDWLPIKYFSILFYSREIVSIHQKKTRKRRKFHYLTKIIDIRENKYRENNNIEIYFFSFVLLS
jgi:hypothetical protein